MARLLSVKNVRPAHGGKAGHGKLGNNNIILSTGTMADQQLSSLISANDDPDMAIVRIKSQVSGLGRALRNIGTVSVLHDNTPSVAYDIAQAVVERPINKTGTVKPEGAVGACVELPAAPHLGKLPQRESQPMARLFPPQK